MSLLMDALRKAEQVKKQKRMQADTSEEKNTTEISDLQLAPEPLGASAEDALQAPRQRPAGSEPLKIEIAAEEAESFQETPVVLEAWEGPENDAETQDLQEPPAQPLAVEPLAMEGNSFTEVPSPAPARENVLTTEPIPMPTGAAADMGIAPGTFTQDSRQAAQSVFLAKSRHKRQIFRRKFFGFAALLILGIGGAAGFLYLSAVNPSLVSQSQPVVSIPPPPGEPSESQPAIPSPAIGQAHTIPAKAVNPYPNDHDSTTIPTEASDSQSDPPGKDSRPARVPAATMATTVIATAATLPGADPPEAGFVEPRPLPYPGAEAAAPPAISISRRVLTPQNDTLLAVANAAFEKGQYQQARKDYQQIRQTNPEHRGALLGLAALAVRGQDPAQARDLYLRLLTKNPSDPLAKAGVLSVMAGGDPARLESELKSLIKVHPNLSPLSFLLGNLYAAGQRWSEAQASYFSAVQASGREGAPAADYCFNLAVSLEHLGQTAAADRYYREALRLAEHRPAGFNKEALQERLASLAEEAGK